MWQMSCASTSCVVIDYVIYYACHMFVKYPCMHLCNASLAS
jgi:hypothetical protein